LAAAHIHHGLHADADRWTAFCAETCSALAVPLTIRQVDARPVAGASPEEAARTARYTALSDLLGPGDTLLTAQHQDDQAETLLLQLFRGAGPAGLAAMPERTPFGTGFLVRPLLDFRRQDLVDYAVKHRLNWVEDTSNADLRFDRNYLRRTILPLLEQRWPGLSRNLGRSARHCAEADGLLGELAQEMLAALRDPLRNTLSVERLRAHSPARQRLIVRAWLRDSGCATPSTALMARMLGEMLPAGADRQPVIRWNGVQIRRFHGEKEGCADACRQPGEGRQWGRAQDFGAHHRHG
jgi:tRNA(Ile)-lysidine synthase